MESSQEQTVRRPVPEKPYVGRLAPSPTGALHLGNARTFMIAWLRARSLGGRVVMRMEDLDHPRDKPGAAAAAIEDLRWLGFDWDEEYVQSERKAEYRAALEKLRSLRSADGGALVYPCACSRRDVENAQSAPHAGEQLFYPGTCRGRFSRWEDAVLAKGGAAPCWRFRTDAGRKVAFDDVFAGRVEQDVAATLGDFPVARDEFGAGYTLAVVVDDAAMGVTEVVRGRDILSATPRQIFLQRLLGYGQPEYVHIPLMTDSQGRRLAKRDKDLDLTALGKRFTPEKIIGRLACSAGLLEEARPATLESLIALFDWSKVKREDLRLVDMSGD